MNIDANSLGTGASSNPSKSLCDAIKCGAYPSYNDVPGGVATVVYCSQTYGAQALSYCDSQCHQFWGQIEQNNPQFAPLSQKCNPQPIVSQPDVATVAPTVAPSIQTPLPVLTPQNIVQPIPSIQAALEPIPAPAQQCSLWCDLNAAIAEHPMASLAILLGVGMLLKGNRR